MSSHPLQIVAGLFAAGLFACIPAHAANTQASLSNIEFHLIDLDLTDNISPSITFQNKQWGGELDYLHGSEGGKNVFSGFDTFSATYTNGSVSATTAATSMAGRAQTGALGREKKLSVSVSTKQDLTFILSPSTRLIFSAQGDAFVDRDGIDSANARASFTGWIRTTINGVYGREDAGASIDVGQGASSGLLHGSLDTGRASATGMLTAYTSAYLYHAEATSPVPEPETCGMLMAGLLVLGGAARRKARKGARQA